MNRLPNVPLTPLYRFLLSLSVVHSSSFIIYEALRVPTKEQLNYIIVIKKKKGETLKLEFVDSERTSCDAHFNDGTVCSRQFLQHIHAHRGR